jgi:hypothetical protein
LSGRIELVDISQAIELVPKLTESLIRKRARQGRLQWFKFSYGLVRYSKASILALGQHPLFYNTAEVCRITGIRQWTTVNNMFAKTGMLELIEHPERIGWPAVTHEALVAFLPYLLPRGDPNDWIDDRLADPDWPLHQREAAVYLGRTMPQVYQMLNNGFPFIWAPSKTERLLPVDALLALVESEPMSIVEVAHIFGVTRQACEVWQGHGYLTCHAHKHVLLENERPQLYRACVHALLRESLSPGIKAGVWIKARARTTEQLMSLDDAAKLLGMTRAELIDAAVSGEIGGVRTPRSPQPTWRFSPTRIKRLSWQRKRQNE